MGRQRRGGTIEIDKFPALMTMHAQKRQFWAWETIMPAGKDG